jgi:hypothetical protein
MFDVRRGCYFFPMSEKDYDPDDIEPGMSEGDVHSGPGGYEGMGYTGGYAAEYLEKEEESEDDDDDDDFNEDEANG